MIKHYLETNIPAFNYSFTNSSAQHWPYYRAFELGEKIPIDSLMPPHTFIHKMVPSEKHHQPEEDEFLVQIEIFAEPDTLPNYSVTILSRKNNEFQLSAPTGLHYIHPSEYQTSEQLADILLKSIIRYSFK